MSMKKVPLRQCIGCQEMKSKKEMIRVIKTAEDEIMLEEVEECIYKKYSLRCWLTEIIDGE